MSEKLETPEWLAYFIKRPMQGLLVVTATILFFVALVLFLRDVQNIEKHDISIEDGESVIRYTTDSLLVIVPTAIIFFFVGVLYTIEHGVFGPYIAWCTVGVGLVLLMIAAVEKDPGLRFIFSNSGWVAFSAGLGFFGGVHVEKMRRTDHDVLNEPPSVDAHSGKRLGTGRSSKRPTKAVRH